AKPVALGPAFGHETECRGQQGDGVRSVRTLDAATAEPEERFGAVEIREPRALGERACALERRNGGVELAEVHPRPGIAEEDAQRQVWRRRGRNLDLAERCDRLGVAVLFR